MSKQIQNEGKLTEIKMMRGIDARLSLVILPQCCASRDYAIGGGEVLAAKHSAVGPRANDRMAVRCAQDLLSEVEGRSSFSMISAATGKSTIFLIRNREG